jgi:hypothetical protein
MIIDRLKIAGTSGGAKITRSSNTALEYLILEQT